MAMNSHYEPEDWIAAVGRGLIAFGQIEYATHITMKSFCRDPIIGTLATLNLEKKLEIVDSLLSQYNHADVKSLVALFRRVKPLTHTRNLIAHNPLVLDLYEAKDGDYMVDSRIRSLRNEKKHYTLQQVQDFANEAEELGARLIQEAVLCGAKAILAGGP